MKILYIFFLFILFLLVNGTPAPWSEPVIQKLSDFQIVLSNSTSCPGGIDFIVNGVTYNCVGGANTKPLENTCTNGLIGIQLNNTLVCGTVGDNIPAGDNRTNCTYGGFEFMFNEFNTTICYDDPNESSKFAQLFYNTNVTSYLLSQFSTNSLNGVVCLNHHGDILCGTNYIVFNSSDDCPNGGVLLQISSTNLSNICFSYAFTPSNLRFNISGDNFIEVLNTDPLSLTYNISFLGTITSNSSFLTFVKNSNGSFTAFYTDSVGNTAINGVDCLTHGGKIVCNTLYNISFVGTGISPFFVFNSTYIAVRGFTGDSNIQIDISSNTDINITLNPNPSVTSVTTTNGFNARTGSSLCVYNPFNNASTCIHAANSMNTNTIIALPATNGSNGQAIVTDGNGNLRYVKVAQEIYKTCANGISVTGADAAGFNSMFALTDCLGRSSAIAGGTFLSGSAVEFFGSGTISIPSASVASFQTRVMMCGVQTSISSSNINMTTSFRNIGYSWTARIDFRTVGGSGVVVSDSNFSADCPNCRSVSSTLFSSTINVNTLTSCTPDFQFSFSAGSRAATKFTATMTTIKIII